VAGGGCPHWPENISKIPMAICIFKKKLEKYAYTEEIFPKKN
jgi:hypothetical protein